MHDASWVQVSWVEVSGVQVSWVQVSWVPDLRFSPRLCTKMSRVQVSWVRGQPNWEDSSSETPKMDRQKGAGAAELGGLLERNTQNQAAASPRETQEWVLKLGIRFLPPQRFSHRLLACSVFARICTIIACLTSHQASFSRRPIAPCRAPTVEHHQ